MKKNYSHKVTLVEQRRKNKKRSDFLRKNVRETELKSVFNRYYKDQVRALYENVIGK
ncbi:MAG: hypothetical protein PHH49_04020 [Candidatus Omnitrophica bacterium]|nr:hypothetical protein [Candidatus Omnitrophota bacterium]MDD5488115.1 hypothetical protein [Candidatus Omnitrophota bacterium]